MIKIVPQMKLLPVKGQPLNFPCIFTALLVGISDTPLNIVRQYSTKNILLLIKVQNHMLSSYKNTKPMKFITLEFVRAQNKSWHYAFGIYSVHVCVI